MPYCTSDEVAGEFKGVTFTETTSVTKATVDGFIAEADAEIDGSLARRYQVPITGTQALLLVKRISRAIVARRLRPILQVDAGSTENKAAPSSVPKFDPDKALRSIADGLVILTDAKASTLRTGVRSYNALNSIEPTFKRNEDQW